MSQNSDRPLNIAFFCDAYKPTCSGVAVSVETTAQELRARGHRVTIYAPRYNGFEEHDANVIRFPAGHWFRAKDFPVAWPLLPRASLRTGTRFRRANYDIVHSHSPFTIGTTGARWARRNGTPVVFTFHTLYHRYLHYVPAPSAWTRSYIVWWVRQYCRLCDHIIAPSRVVAQVVSHLAPDIPRSVVPTGVDVARFSSGNRSELREQLKINNDQVVLLYVGRLVREKNLEFLLRSTAPLLRQSSTRSILILVGGGPALDFLRELSHDLGIADKVVFTGFVPPEKTPDYYAASDVFVFASRTETQGVSIAEALAASLPCVVVGAMGAAEAVTNGVNGIVAPPHENAFREAVSQLLSDSQLRASMSQKARELSSSLSQSHSVDALLELYRSVINARQ